MLYLTIMVDFVRSWAGVEINNEDGQGLIEYVLIGALISIVAIAAIITIGPKLTAQFTAISGAIPAGTTP